MLDCYFCSLCAYCFSFNDFTRHAENMPFICPRSHLVMWQNLMRCGAALDSRSFCMKYEMKDRIFQIFCVFPFWRKLLNVFWVDSVVLGRGHPVVFFNIHMYFIQSQHNINIQSIIHSFSTCFVLIKPPSGQYVSYVGTFNVWLLM
jgi:hypothetical protein